MNNGIRLFLGPLLLATLLPEPAPGQEPATLMTDWRHALVQSPEWYGGGDAVRIADNVLLYQHENGGWDKNINMAAVLAPAEREQVLAQQTEWQTNIDNDATYTQARYLALVYQATEIERFREGFLRALSYLLEAQYENGGWPQYYPLREGYWSRITFNDHAIIGVMELLREIVDEAHPFGFVPVAERARAAAALDKAVDMILRAQLRVDGVPTAWCAQHDEIDLSPRLGRSYELPSISGGESVGVVRYLMTIEDPSPEVIQAVQSAVAWFDQAKVNGIRVEERQDPSLARGRDRVVVEDPDAPPMWARFYEIGTNRPIFSGRDGVKKYSLAEIEHERRVGYAWLGYWAADLLENEYPAWQRRWAPERNVLADG